MAVTEQEMLEDLAYTESEGPADMGEDEWDRLGGRTTSTPSEARTLRGRGLR